MKKFKDIRMATFLHSMIFSTLVLSVTLNPGISVANIYEYDNLNRLTRVTYNNGAEDIYSYDAAGNILSIKSGTDSDGDGILDNQDNCPAVSNANQSNRDGDGAGDVCDADDDADTVLDVVDNCPLIANTDQTDLDGDGAGDTCDFDDDADTVLDTVDNCPLIANTDQADTDADGVGDACDDTFNLSRGGKGIFAISLPGLVALLGGLAIFRRGRKRAKKKVPKKKVPEGLFFNQ